MTIVRALSAGGGALAKVRRRHSCAGSEDRGDQPERGRGFVA
jgi:hypothetical protein